MRVLRALVFFGALVVLVVAGLAYARGGLMVQGGINIQGALLVDTKEAPVRATVETPNIQPDLRSS